MPPPLLGLHVFTGHIRGTLPLDLLTGALVLGEWRVRRDLSDLRGGLYLRLLLQARDSETGPIDCSSCREVCDVQDDFDKWTRIPTFEFAFVLVEILWPHFRIPAVIYYSLVELDRQLIRGQIPDLVSALKYLAVSHELETDHFSFHELTNDRLLAIGDATLRDALCKGYFEIKPLVQLLIFAIIASSLLYYPVFVWIGCLLVPNYSAPIYFALILHLSCQARSLTRHRSQATDSDRIMNRTRDTISRANN